MESKFEETKSDLIELLKAYGQRPIIVKINQDGDDVSVIARTFVKRQLDAAGIDFPINESNKRSNLIINPDLDSDNLTVLFHNVLFELEENYIKEFCQGKPEAEGYINSVNGWIERKRIWLYNTFTYCIDEEVEPFLEKKPDPKFNKGDFAEEEEVSKECLKELRDMGYTRVISVYVMTKLFWDFALRRKIISYEMRNAILFITVDESAADYLKSNIRKYNRFLQEREDDEGGIIAKGKAALKEKRIEINEIKHENNIRQKEQNERLQETLKELVHYRKISKFLRKILQNPCTGFSRSFNMTKEEDIDRFLYWFDLWKLRIRSKDIKRYLAFYKEENMDLFKQKVAAHNAKYPVGLPEEDDEEDTEE